MSKQRGCIIAELEAGEWYCAVADREYDYQFSEGTVYGPAETWRKAFELMQAVESNPGAYSLISHDKVTEYHRKLFQRLSKVEHRQFIRYF